VVTAAAFVPLLLVGGAVTSTESGMAIRGWPDSDGANMFLYPIRLMADPQKFLEHAHRLFGTLVGLHAIALTVYTFAGDRRAGVRIASVALLALVTIQGVLGGYRVIENQQAARLVHGISAQVILAFALALAAWLSPAFKSGPPAVPHAAAGRLRVVTTLLLIALLVQLSLGATYRHLNLVHPAFVGALHSHAAFAVVVAVLALMAGFKAAAVGREIGSPALRRVGRATSHTTGLQLVLGIAAFIAVLLSPTRDAAPGQPAPGVPAWEALVTTAHQIIGAALIGAATLNWVWVRRLVR
jgi:cytochrome c oxidase assembly protein subunit 15